MLADTHEAAMPLPAEDDRLVDAVFQIINSSVDHEAIFEEACSLSKRIKLQSDDRSHPTHLDISVDNFLSVTCQEHQKQSRSSRGDNYPIPTFAKQIIELSKSCSQTNSPLLTPDVRDQFEAVLELLKLKTKDFLYDSGLFQSLVNRHNLPVEMLWSLHSIGAMCLDSYLSCQLNEDSSFIEKFSRELIAFCRGSFESFSSRRKILTGLTGYFIKKAFGEEKSTLKRSFIHLLDSILEGILDLKAPADEVKVLALPTDFLNYQETLPKDTLKRFCVHALSYMLSCKADCHVSDVLKSCSDWKSVDAFGAGRELCRQLFVPLCCEEVTAILLQSFDQLKVSSILTLIFLSALYSTFQETARVMNGHIKLKLSEGLDSSDAVKLSTAFLLVRQSASVGCDDAPTYSSWFETSFGDSSCSLASTRSTFTSLMRFLSSIVPFESAEYLKVHIFKRPAAPAKCRSLYDDYVALAKTRLEDLKVPLQDLSTGIYNNSSVSTDGSNMKVINQAEEDVERTVKAFTDTGKLPTAIIEASIFRKPYFIGKFLPALLKPRYLPDVPDQRMKLISEIHNAGKIPSSVYNIYLQECEKEKQTLLQGVFDVDDDYELEEMILPPFRQLSLRLDNYVKVAGTRNQDKVAESLSQVVDKVRCFLGTASGEGASHDSSDVVDLVQPSNDDVFTQIVSEVLCHTCTLINEWNKLEMRQNRVKFLVAVHRLITGLSLEFSNLKLAFYKHVLLHLESQDVQSMSTATVCACLMTSPSTLNVKHKSHDLVPVQKSYKNILEAVVECLRLNIKSDLEHMLRFWLEYVAAACDLQDYQDDDVCVIEVGSPSSAETHLLSGHVVKQVNLLYRRYKFVTREQKEARLTAFNSDSKRMNSVMSDHRWQALCIEHQYTLSDWIQFELAVPTQGDLLLSSERADFLMEMSKFFIEQPNQATDPALFCSEVLKILATHLAESSRNMDIVGDNLPENFMCFVSLLRKHLMRLPCSNAASMSWLASILDSTDVLPCKSDLLRLAAELPPQILFGNSSSEISSSCVNSAMFIIDHLITSRTNQGGYFSQKATIFIAQGVIWAQQSSQYVSDVRHVRTHLFVLTSVLAHRKILEEKGLFRELSPGWTSQLTAALQWAERWFVESGDGGVPQKSVDVRQRAAALFVVLLHREHHVDIKLDAITPFENVIVCFLELSLSRLVSQSLSSDSDKHSGKLLVEAVVQILSAKGDILVQLLDTTDSGLCKRRQDLGLGQHPVAEFWRDFHILRLAAQIPVQVLLHNTCRNVTLAVVNAYIRVLQYVCDNGIQDSKFLDEMVYSNISAWIKRMVDHTKGDHLQEINTPEAEVCEADLLLFRYMEEKKKGWV